MVAEMAGVKVDKSVDMLIIGAGISGIGAAAHLTMQCPDKSYLILEQRGQIGGTWDLFRYPGVRSDSDMHTLGYRFKPWLHEKTIADGATIREYVCETAEEYGVTDNICFGHKALDANWSSADGQWIITAQREEDGAQISIAANFLFICSGYYSYDEGHRPQFVGEEDFAGEIVHPQFWPENLDYQGKNIVVIGSGATAVTIVPVMAENAAKVTMLQRSPTYIASRPAVDPFFAFIRKFMPAKAAYAITRWRNINMQRFVYYYSRKNPEKVSKRLLAEARKIIPDYRGFEQDFQPKYGPWEQRMCLVPDNDLFHALNAGKAEIITDEIEKFTENGLLLKSGQHIAADIIVTATGLNLVMMGKMQLRLDGAPVNLADHVSYKGVMFNDIPNMASIFGYVNASWTLKVDIVADYICRLLKTMDQKGAAIANPHLADANMPRRPFVEDFSSGYFQRSIENLPKNGDKYPWQAQQNYAAEKKSLTKGAVDDGIMIFSGKNTDVGTK